MCKIRKFDCVECYLFVILEKDIYEEHLGGSNFLRKLIFFPFLAPFHSCNLIEPWFYHRCLLIQLYLFYMNFQKFLLICSTWPFDLCSCMVPYREGSAETFGKCLCMTYFRGILFPGWFHFQRKTEKWGAHFPCLQFLFCFDGVNVLLALL